MTSFITNLSKKIIASTFKNTSSIGRFHTGIRLLSPRVQEKAPDFRGVAVKDGEFKELKLSDFRGKYLVLVFYPLDFTFVCPTELVSFSDQAHQFLENDCDVIGISTDSQFSHLAWTQTPRKNGGVGALKIPLLSDFTKEISKAYNVLIENEGIALRGLFIIDKEGTLRHLSVNDLPVGRSVEETLRLVKAFQFTDKHGEVCPANWDPVKNAATIKPDPAKSKEYFNKT